MKTIGEYESWLAAASARIIAADIRASRNRQGAKIMRGPKGRQFSQSTQGVIDGRRNVDAGSETARAKTEQSQFA
jgi:hypothetical protein